MEPMFYSVFDDTKNLAYLGPEIWGIIPEALKKIDSFIQFKKLKRKWKQENQPFRICKVYIPYVGFK